MRPLEIRVEPLDPCDKVPLLQRIAEDKKKNMEKLSFVSSDYFMVQLPDGSMEKRPKRTMNIDPGVHSVLYLDELAQSFEASAQPPPSLPPISSTVDILPTISEGGKTVTTPTENRDVKVVKEQSEQQARSVPTGPGVVQHRTLHKHMSHAECLQTTPHAHEGTNQQLPGEGAGGGSFRGGTRAR